MINEEIIQGCIKNNADAQEVLYKHFAGKMLSVCLRFAASTDEAEDILQEGFIKVFEKINLYRQDGSFEGWIRKIMINTALDVLRKDKNHHNAQDIEGMDYKLPHFENTIDKMSADDILKLIRTIPAGYRTVFNLYAIEGYSHKEIGEKLGFTENTSKSQFWRAREYIKEMLYKNKVIISE